MCIMDGCTDACTLKGLQCHMKAHHVKGDYSLQELVIVDLFDHSTRENSEDSKGSDCDKDNTVDSGEDNKEDDLQDNLEDTKDVGC